MASSPGGARARTDAELIAATRRGDDASYATLADRHREAAMRLAVRLSERSPQKLVDGALAVVAAELRAAAGPNQAFRPHLLMTLRRRAQSRTGRVRVDGRSLRPGMGEGRDDLRAAMTPALVRAFRSMPESGQVALWHTEVDAEPLLDTATLLGVNATDVAELAFGARDTLRAAQLADHRGSVAIGPCRWSGDRLAAHTQGRLSASDAAKVDEHLSACGRCAELYPAVGTLEKDLAGVVAAIVLGPAAWAYLDRPVPYGRGVAAGAAHGLTTRAAVFAGVAIFTVAASLVGATAFIDDEGARVQYIEGQAAPRTPPLPAPLPIPLPVLGPASGSGSTGDNDQPRAARGSSSGAVAAPEPVPLPGARENAKAPSAPVGDPAAQTEGPAAQELDLGVGTVALTPRSGPLGLPGIGLETRLLG
ncbi:MAG: zf-HC2 domain-containing protein [Sporichthyaceae bacterium]